MTVQIDSTEYYIKYKCIELAQHSEMIRNSINRMNSICSYLEELVDQLGKEGKDSFTPESTLPFKKQCISKKCIYKTIKRMVKRSSRILKL